MNYLEELKTTSIKAEINCRVLNMVQPRKNNKRSLSSLNFLCYHNRCGFVNTKDCDNLINGFCHKAFSITDDSLFATHQMMIFFYKSGYA